MRLLFIVQRAPPATGGIQSYLRHLSRELGSRHEITVLGERISEHPQGRLSGSLKVSLAFEPFELENQVHVCQLRPGLGRRSMMLPQAALVLPGLRRHAYGRMRGPLTKNFVAAIAPLIADQAEDADVVHVWGGGMLGAAALSAARRTGTPFVTTPFVHRGQWGDDRSSVRTYQHADRAVGLLACDVKVLEDLGVASSRLAECGVCSPGVIAAGGAAWRQKHQVGGPLVAFLGVRRQYKGVDLLLGALEPLSQMVPSATSMVFAGPGREIANKGALRVIDRGLVDESEKAAILQAADVVCLPSAGEIFPVTILEAWSAGTPVVTSDIPPLRELVQRSGGGVTSERAPQALARALADVLLGDGPRLGAAGHAYWRACATPQAVANAYEIVYREVISGRIAPADEGASILRP